HDRPDQVRGISPIASGLNAFRDVYQNLDYALVRAKISQLYGLVIKRAPGEGDTLPEPGESPEDGAEHPGQEGDFTFDPDGGPIQLHLDTGEEAELLESKTPSSEFQNFHLLVVSMALKTLDIPL